MASKPSELALVMPVYNEEGAIEKVIRDWIQALDALGIGFEIHAYDDGSRDRTGQILEALGARDPRVRLHRKANSGHGPTILQGYRENCDKPWIFQIDSDDEMKPEHFGRLWAERCDHDILVGERDRIGQPVPRRIVSAVSRATVHLLFGSAIHDVNAPYRLMRSAFFERVFRAIPEDSFAPNLLVSGAASILGARIFTLPVPQTQRTTGEVSIRKWRLFKAAARAFRQTLTAVFRIRRLRAELGVHAHRTSSTSVDRPSVSSWTGTLAALLVASLVMNLLTVRDRDALVEAHRSESVVPRDGSSSRPERSNELEGQLAALGYGAHATVDAGDGNVGVDLYDRSRTADGLNVSFAEWGCKSIDFLGNDGKVVRRIDVSALEKIECYEVKAVGDGFVFLARPNLYRLDFDGKVVWQLTEGFYFHHDFDATSDMIVALDTLNVEDSTEGGKRRYDHRIVVLRPDGRVVKIIPLHPLFSDALRAYAASRNVSPYDGKAVGVLGMDEPGDFYHVNGIQILERDSAIGKRGNVLVSLRTIDTIATIDLESEKVVWSWGPGVLDHQHHPQLLENGHVLVFDNGWHRGHSRVIELDPVSNTIVWKYEPGSAEDFFTRRRGGAYRLENGNTLITESDRGRAFEVTKEGRVVWQYWMPLSESDNDASMRQTIFRLQRLSGSEFARLRESWGIPERG